MYPVNTVRLRMKAIETKFIPHKKSDQNKGSQTGGQAKNVDQRKDLAFEQVPPRDLQVIPEHDMLFLRLMPQ
jgi:hypothetical protein